MPRLKLHGDGWLTLPESFRRQLGLERGDDLEAQLVDGTIVLRPSKGSVKAVEEGIAAEAAEAVPAPSALAAAALAPEQLAAEPEVPPAPKRRGRPPKAKG
jgi:bifunctional DNA-binding transcriptional regulator/antitoxin component of YhaV-PrlF toxin-antitoxin module